MHQTRVAPVRSERRRPFDVRPACRRAVHSKFKHFMLPPLLVASTVADSESRRRSRGKRQALVPFEGDGILGAFGRGIAILHWAHGRMCDQLPEGSAFRPCPIAESIVH